MQMEGKINSWAIRWVFAQSNLDMYTVYPKKSYILNDGCDGSGTHVGDTREYSTDISQGAECCRFEQLKIEKKIANAVRQNIDKNQKEYFLREQAKVIQQELGEEDDEIAELRHSHL